MTAMGRLQPLTPEFLTTALENLLVVAPVNLKVQIFTCHYQAISR